MNLSNKCTFYKICIRPVMTYAGPVFRPCRLKLTLPIPDFAKFLQKSLRRTLEIQPERAPGTALGDSARAVSPRDFLCRDAHLVASIEQSRADGIPCRSAAIDEVLKTPIYWDYGQQPSNMLLRGFLVHDCRTHPTYAGGWQLIRRKRMQRLMVRFVFAMLIGWLVAGVRPR
ncbi:hypothetical protein EVAR_76222_1 [Eumeta japonica]|uniref:Uncharacterized protein n=1 Tax=Eumeta variegata TaxID=151549 RepID=A0A4C1UNW0_EUMVA|nr:hypothetical protein EVAR_76222_1 [Eumeta japonica]